MTKKTITSRELLEQINYFRKKEGKKKLKHDNFLKVIRDEFSEDFNDPKFEGVKESNGVKIYGVKESHYIDKKGEKRPMFILTLSQAKQVLLRESKYVRHQIIKRIEELEKKILQIALNHNNPNWQGLRLEEKAMRRQETDTIKKLVEYAKEQGSKNANMLYTVYSKLPYKLLGLESRQKESLTFWDLADIGKLEEVFYRVIEKGMEEKKHYKGIYNDCEEAGKIYINLLKGA